MLDTEKAYRELLYGPDAAPAPLLSRFSTQAIPVEGVYLRVDDGEHLRYRAKIVRGDFIQMIEEGGRWEKKKAVIQQCDTEDWGYFSALLCNGSVQCVHERITSLSGSPFSSSNHSPLPGHSTLLATSTNRMP